MEETVYKIKQIKFPPWNKDSPRTVSILLQDENGPCPLIAILNVLLLKGTLSLPPGVGEITSAKTIQLLAEHLLDTNFSRPQVQIDANFQHNLSDAIAILPKLTTGIDVNVRFDRIRNMEFTNEIAVFDLLGIDLVHGWLVDPQDKETSAAIGSKSYNELVLQLVSCIGNAPTAEAQATAFDHATTADTATCLDDTRNENINIIKNNPHNTPPPPTTAAAANTTAETLLHSFQEQRPQNHQHPNKIDAKMLSDALDSTLRITVPDGPSTSDIRSASSTSESMMSHDSMASTINYLLSDTIRDAFKSPTPSSIRKSTQKSFVIADGNKEILEGDKGGNVEENDACDGEASADHGRHSSSREQEHDSTRVLLQQSPDESLQAETSKKLPTTQQQQHHAADGPQSPLGNDVLLIKEFLDLNPSQLTIYGLSCLMDDLKENQLSVFFRNNHFNVLLRNGHGLYILVTDQGYLYESDVVWEHLNNVDGDTQFLGWNLERFAPHQEKQDGDGLRSGTMSYNQSSMAGAVKLAAAPASSDADLALAMQLQQEEEERVRILEEQRRERSAAAARKGTGGERHGGRRKKEGKEKKSDCCVM